MAATAYTQDSPKNGFKKSNQLTLASDVSMPPKASHDEFNKAKYRAVNNSLYINFFGKNGSRLVLKYNDAFKLKYRTTCNTEEGYETLLLNYYDSTNGEANNDGKPLVYSVRQFVRINYKSKKMLLIEKVTENLLTSNESSKITMIENFGILISFKEFNDAIDSVDSTNTLSSVNASTKAIENDI